MGGNAKEKGGEGALILAQSCRPVQKSAPLHRYRWHQTISFASLSISSSKGEEEIGKGMNRKFEKPAEEKKELKTKFSRLDGDLL